MKKTGKLIKNKKRKIKSRKNLTYRKKGGLPNFRSVFKQKQPVSTNAIENFLNKNPNALGLPSVRNYYTKYIRNALNNGKISEIMHDTSSDAQITQKIMKQIYPQGTYEDIINANCDFIAKRIQIENPKSNPITSKLIYDFTYLRCKKGWSDFVVNKIVELWPNTNMINQYLPPHKRFNASNQLTVDETNIITNYINSPDT